ncbi:MAG: hypothetical protein QGD94_12930, partial [Planctomycetia bacterium]|nr:hypothetical protein [Planctomycetia bacterium]
MMDGKKYPRLSFHVLLHRISDGDDHALILPWSEKKLEEMYPRTVKKRPTVYTTARIGAARGNIRKYGWARRQAAGSIRLAERTIRAPLERLASEMPSPNMPRGWNNHCPHCGWWGHGLSGGMDIVKHPWEVVCPVCGKMIPGFDAKAFFFSGRDEWGRFRWDRADDSLLPKGEKFREAAMGAFNAYCRGYWSNGFEPAIVALADAFVFTGKKIYARYALGLLVHFAFFYPYFLQKDCMAGDTHPGAMLMDCHEAMLMKSVALAYDKIFSALGEPGMVKTADRMVRRYGTRLSSGVEVKAFIEGRVFK